MAGRPKQRSLTALRVFLSILFSMIVLLGGLAVLLWLAYQRLNELLPPLLGAAWAGVQNITAALLIDISPYAAVLLVGALLLAWLLARWAARPLNRLVAS